MKPLTKTKKVAKAKQEATPEYLHSLRTEREEVAGVLEIYKKDLYRILADAKLFDPAYNLAEDNCFKQTQKLKKLDTEIERVEKELRFKNHGTGVA